MFLLAVIFGGCNEIMEKLYFVEYVSFTLLSNIALVALTNCFVAMPMLTARHEEYTMAFRDEINELLVGPCCPVN